MSPRSESYRLLQDETQIKSKESLGDIDNSNSDQESELPYVHPLKASAKKNVVMLLLLLSTAINTGLAVLLAVSLFHSSLQSRTVVTIEPADVSLYAGLTRDPSAHFPYSTGYGPDVTNHSLLDERWEAIDINAGVVAISDDWAAEHNLASTQRFPWDPSKGVYLLSAFHTLHCLKNIHRLLYDAHHGRPLSRDITHAMHCVDHLRKDAMCEADDYLLPSPKTLYGNPGPRGQSRVCRNWDALVVWADNHNACYQHISDDEKGFAEGHAEIERYRNCPPASPYGQAMRKYFGENQPQKH